MYKVDYENMEMETVAFKKEEFLSSGICNEYGMENKPSSHIDMILAIRFEENSEEYDLLKNEYEELCDKELLERCMRKLTQNANESLYSRIWRFCPKVIPYTLPILQLAIYKSVLHYHRGYLKGYILEILKIPLTKDMVYL